MINTKINEMNLSETEASKIKDEILHKEGENLRKQRQKMQVQFLGIFGDVDGFLKKR